MSDDFKTKYRDGHATANGNGRPHAFTRRGREFAQRLVESEQYRKWLYDRIEQRTLDSSIERMLWAYAYGRPKEYVEVTTRTHDLAGESVDVLQSRVERLGRLLSQLNAATTKAEAERLIAALAEEEQSAPSIH